MRENFTCPSFDEGECVTYPCVFETYYCKDLPKCKWKNVNFDKTKWNEKGKRI